MRVAIGVLLAIGLLITLSRSHAPRGNADPDASPRGLAATSEATADAERRAGRSHAQRGNEGELFNGRDLTGWEHIGGGRAEVRDGLLVLENDSAHRPGYLVSNVTARDFEARLRCRMVRGDSGFFFRSQRHPRTATEIVGPQVQLNPDPDRGLGGLFEIHGRGWLCKPNPPLKLKDPTDRLDVHISARNATVHVRVNEQTTVEWSDPITVRGGFFALQIHGGGHCRVEFERISVRVEE